MSHLSHIRAILLSSAFAMGIMASGCAFEDLGDGSRSLEGEDVICDEGVEDCEVEQDCPDCESENPDGEGGDSENPDGDGSAEGDGDSGEGSDGDSGEGGEGDSGEGGEGDSGEGGEEEPGGSSEGM